MLDKKIKLVIAFAVAGVIFSLGAVVLFVWLTGGEFEEAFKYEEMDSSSYLRPRPERDELESIMLFEQERMFPLKKTSDVDVAFVQIPQIEMLCFRAVPRVKNPLENIKDYSNQLREYVSIYLQDVHPNEVISSEGREHIKVELLKGMNEVLKNHIDTESDLIYNLVIESWIYA